MFYSYTIIISRYNNHITNKLLQGALARFKEKEIPDNQVRIITVPGAIEIPLVAQRIAKNKASHAIICLGAVIRGDTDHYDYVCQQVSHGCQTVMMNYDIPVIFGILTTDNEQQAEARVGGSEGHKGVDAVDTAIEMVELLQSL